MTETLSTAKSLQPGDRFRYFSSIAGWPPYGPYTVREVLPHPEGQLTVLVAEDDGRRQFAPDAIIEILLEDQ